MDNEMAPVQYEAPNRNVMVNGWQEGNQNVPGFVTVMDQTTGTKCANKQGQSLVDATAEDPARPAGDWQVERKLLEATDRERNRIGRDLHDSVQGNLAGISMMLEGMKQRLASSHVGYEHLTADIDSICHVVRETIRQTRGIAMGLCPMDLAVDGLARAFSLLASTTTSLFGIACQFRCEKPVRLENEAVATQLYYIAHEAVNNACKHAKARSILITIESSRECLTLTVEDDGCGLPEKPAPVEGMGLGTMHYRAKLIGARLGMRRGGQHGATVECVIPAVSVATERPLAVAGHSRECDARSETQLRQ